MPPRRHSQSVGRRFESFWAHNLAWIRKEVRTKIVSAGRPRLYVARLARLGPDAWLIAGRRIGSGSLNRRQAYERPVVDRQLEDVVS